MSETAGNAERRIDPVRRIETAMAQASAWGLEFIKSIDDLKSENARLSKRVGEIEEGIKEIQRMTESLQGRANEPLSRLAAIGFKTRCLLEKEKKG